MKKLAPILISALAIFSTPSLAQNRTEAGTLNCKMGPTVGLIVGSVQRMSCTFSTRSGRHEHYDATFRRLGLDLGVKAGGRMVWAVYARTNALGPRSLAGTYVGASGDISLGLGVGANAMAGGSGNTITLQPLSVQGQVGVNVALGAAGFRLR
ncbi:MAG: DUF992 domain-containing protein [Pseudolabrys sp.]